MPVPDRCNRLIIDLRKGRIARFDGQIAIESHTRNKFSAGGDSGSIIVNKHSEPIGLLFAGSGRGGNDNAGITFANPINAVLDHLDIDIVV